MSGRRAASRRLRRNALVAATVAVAAWCAAWGGASPAHAQPLLRSFDSGGLEARSAALILSGQEGGALPVSVRPLPGAGETGELPFLVEIDGRVLLEAGTPEVLAEVHAYLIAGSGRLVGFTTRALRFDAARARQQGDDWIGIRYLGRLPLGEGAADVGGDLSLRVLVLQRAADRFGLRMADVDLSASETPALTDAVPDGWWLAADRDTEASDRLFRADLPPPDWTVPGGGETMQAEIVLPTYEPGKRRKMKWEEREDVRWDYWTALRSLAGGRDEKAAEDVVAFEQALMADGAREQDLARSQMEAAEELAEVEAESLAPLIRLHLDLYARHLENREYLLSTHSRRMAEVYITLYLKHSRSRDAPMVAAGALAELARHLLDRGNYSEAREVLLRVVDHQADHRTGLLALVTVDEIIGRYEEAVTIGKQLTEAHPDLAEGWLRLAVNHERVGQSKAARQAFERVLADPQAPPWVTQLAYEEMARIHLADKQPGAAAQLLTQALERFPESQRLYIQAAAARTRLGAIQEARSLLRDLDRRLALGGLGADEAGSPRLRYGDWPDEAFAASRAAFTERAATRSAELAQALNIVVGPPRTTSPGGGGDARGGGR